MKCEAVASFVLFVLVVVIINNYIRKYRLRSSVVRSSVNEMGRPPCCDKSNVKRGLWTAEEDAKILAHVSMHGTGNWTSVPKKAGLKRCGKSCRLRWTNYLRPDLKHENFTPQEEELIIKLHETLGSRWSLIAAQLPGRTDNDVKNFWNTKLRKKLFEIGIDPVTHKPFSQIFADYGKIGGLLNKSTARFGSLNRDLRNAFMPKSEPISQDPNSNYSSMTSTRIRPKMEPIQDIPLNNNNNSWELLAQLHAIQPYLMHEVGGSSSSSSSVSSNFTQISSPPPPPPPPPQNQTFMNQITPSSPIFSWSEFLLDQDMVLPNQQEEHFDWFQSSPGSVSINEPKNNEIKINEDLGQDYGSMVRSGQGTEFTAVGTSSSSTTTTTTTSGNSFIEGILDQESELHMWEFPNLFDESSY